MSYLKFSKTELINLEYSLKREVLRTNKIGCYGCTTIIDCNTRKYHGLLVSPLPKLDDGRHVLLSSLDETIIQHDHEFNLALHKYAGDNYEPKGHKYIRDFTSDPIPKLLYRIGDVILSKERLLVEDKAQILIKYTLIEAQSPTRIRLKPFLAFRNIHALSKANMHINTKFISIKNGISSNLYKGYPSLHMQTSKVNEFIPAPDWYYNIEYIEEQKRGYEYKEDLFVPGYFEMPLKKGDAIIFSAGLAETTPTSLKTKFSSELKKHIPRDNLNNCLTNTIHQFFVSNKKDTNIIAGYPWLESRLRDTFVSLPGLTLINNDTGRFKKVMASALGKLKGHFFQSNSSDNNFSADISLWFVWCLQQYSILNPKVDIWKEYGTKIKAILNGYIKEKKHFSVHDNLLIYANDSSYENSWMNAHTNGEAMIKRTGYIVETNALWYNAIQYAAELAFYNGESSFSNKWLKIGKTVKKSFKETFWLEKENYLADYVNANEKNIQIRPNQVFATSLPFSPLSKDKQKAVLDKIKRVLLVSYGLRTLAPTDPQYKAKYTGNHQEREWAAFNGSVWPWLFTHYFEGLYKVYPKSAMRASHPFLKTMKNEIQTNGLCSISELYHGDPPHNAKGAISFAKNTAELLRLKWMVEQRE